MAERRRLDRTAWLTTIPLDALIQAVATAEGITL